MSKIDNQDRVEMVEILSLPDNEAVRWLKENTYSEVPHWPSGSDFEMRKLACFAFSRRDSPRLRLAVAKYGAHSRTLKRLFDQGTSMERLAVLSNPFIGPTENMEGSLLYKEDAILSESDAMDILRNFTSNKREFGVLARNPNIDREWLSRVIENWANIDGFEGEGLLWLVHHLIDNPIISTPRDDTFIDGFDEFQYDQLNLGLAKLLQKVPVNLNWADVLSRMLQKLHLPFVPDFEVNLLDRWRDPEPTEKGDRWYFDYLREQITKFLLVPNHLSDVVKDVSIDHPDAAVRKGLYSSLPPYKLFPGKSGYGISGDYPSFEYLDESKLTEAQQAVVDICNKCFEQDKNDFVDSLTWNDNFWKTREEREFLHDLCWHLAEDPHYDMDLPNSYRARESYYVKNYPSWFKDDDLVDIPFEDTVEGKLDHLRSEIQKLKEEFESQSLEDLAEQQRSHFELVIEQTQDQITRLSDSLSEKTYELGRTIEQGSVGAQLKMIEDRIRRQGGFIWLLIAAVVVVGYFSLN